MLIDTNLLSQIASNSASAASAPMKQSPAGVVSSPAAASPADDASALSIAALLGSQTQGTLDASDSVSNAVSFTQAQDGYLQDIAAALNQMNQLSQAAQDPATNPSDLTANGDEFGQLNSYILEAGGKSFNGINLFSDAPLSVRVDANGTTLNLPAVGLMACDTTAGTSIDTPSQAASASAAIQDALQQVNSNRATVQSNQEALNQVSEQLSVTLTNLDSASVPIADPDAANAATQSAAQAFLSQPANALGAQAGSLPDTILDLIQ